MAPILPDIGPEKISAVFRALKYEEIDELKHLIDEHPQLVNCRSSAERTPLHTAARRGLVEAVRFLLEKGADPEARDYRDWTALDWAIDHHQEAVVDLLRGRLRST